MRRILTSTTLPTRSRPRRSRPVALLLLLLGVCGSATLLALGSTPPRSAQAAPTLPPGWPTTLQLGLADAPGGAAALHAAAPFAFRYQYLSGGVNSGSGWATWNAGGAFATSYIQDSLANGLTPVFSYYQIRQSTPGNSLGEAQGVLANFQNATTMTAYFQDLTLFFQKAGAFPSTLVVLHVEPDAWGYLEQASSANSATSVPVQVAATGNPDLTGLPNTAAGFAQAVKLLRDRYAPNVALGYHLSGWGTGDDILYSKPADSTVVADANKAAAFYQSLGTAFDLTFTDASDRDAAFKQYQYGDGGASWWSSADYARNALFLQSYHAVAAPGIVLWQIPFGNTKLRTENNSWDHYQDNHVETLLGDAARTQLTSYLQAGVVGLLFGRGADGATCACDAAGDGVTNPAAINGNTGVAVSADDDGGYFKQQAQQYYQTGALALGGNPAPAITSPAAGGTLSGTTVTFSWSAATGADSYWLYAGNTSYGAQYANRGPLADSTSQVTISSLPNDGSTVHVLLQWHDTNGWHSAADVTYTAVNQAALTSPVPGILLGGSSVTFLWTAVTGADRYWLYAGSQPLGYDLANRGPLTGTSVAITGLPTDGRCVYVTWQSHTSTGWQTQQAVYQAASSSAAAACLAQPTGSVLSGGQVSLSWTPGVGVDKYWVYVGKAAYGAEYANQGPLTGTTGAAVTVPTNSSAVTVTLQSHTAAGWITHLYTFTAAGGSGPAAAPASSAASRPSSESPQTHDPGLAVQPAPEPASMPGGTPVPPTAR